MLCHENNIVSIIGRLASSNAQSPPGRNIAYLRYRCNVVLSEPVPTGVWRIHKSCELSLEKQGIVNNVKTLMHCERGEMYIDGFDDNMVADMMLSLCID